MSKNIKETLADETNKLVYKIIDEGIDGIVGGWPCQDISWMGEGAGISGARSGLWRHLFRTILLVRPKIALMENVAALLHRGMERVLGDLAGIGYDTEWHCIRADAAGLPHIRKRIFTVAYPYGERRERVFPEKIQGQQGISWCEDVRRFEDLPERSHLYPSKLCGGGHGARKRLDVIGNGNAPEIIKQISGVWHDEKEMQLTDIKSVYIL